MVPECCLSSALAFPADTLVHFDTPLTREHELALLRAAGFSAAEILQNWGATGLLRAIR